MAASHGDAPTYLDPGAQFELLLIRMALQTQRLKELADQVNSALPDANPALKAEVATLTAIRGQLRSIQARIVESDGSAHPPFSRAVAYPAERAQSIVKPAASECLHTCSAQSDEADYVSGGSTNIDTPTKFLRGATEYTSPKSDASTTAPASPIPVSTGYMGSGKAVAITPQKSVEYSTGCTNLKTDASCLRVRFLVAEPEKRIARLRGAENDDGHTSHFDLSHLGEYQTQDQDCDLALVHTCVQ
eukprot:TRINITY_DN58439_c0_g1_i1.p1 TRINITY_DN58439_c0_g1~~TRINITY_DN58439_c0_g1_i1.p1  ORF type:complete len:261 (+),score=17.04 TRINITY_DN58439_c0_g1_i1:48-785(+)